MTGASAVRLGLLGCGWIARNRLRQISEAGRVDVVAIADTDPGVAQYLPEIAPGARLVDTLSDTDLRGLDGVMISTPSALHYGQAKAFLDRRIPVFVQKPLALGAEDARHLLALAAAADVPLGTDLCYRHLNSAVAVRHALQTSSIGTPFLVEGCFHNAYRPGSGWSHDPALAGGGALIDLGIHLMDLVAWLTGQPLVLERARLLRNGRPRGIGEVEDFATADLSLPDGAEVRLATSWDASTGRDADIRRASMVRKGVSRSSIEKAPSSTSMPSAFTAPASSIWPRTEATPGKPVHWQRGSPA